MAAPPGKCYSRWSGCFHEGDAAQCGWHGGSTGLKPSGAQQKLSSGYTTKPPDFRAKSLGFKGYVQGLRDETLWDAGEMGFCRVKRST
jgi:hypothetical protein